MTPTAERIAYRLSGDPSQMDRRAWDQGLKTTDSLCTLQASNVEKSTIESRKETRGLMARDGAPQKRGPGLQSLGGVGYTAEEKNACGNEAMMNGGTCEPCQ